MQHAAYAKPLDQLDVVLIDDNGPMLAILRAILKAFAVRRQRSYQCAQQAIDEMIADPPDLIITDWYMLPVNGLELIRIVRSRHLEPLCFTAIAVISGHASRSHVLDSYRAGAHDFIVKPVSPKFLMERLMRMQADDRSFELSGSHYVIAGMDDLIRRTRSPAQGQSPAGAGQSSGTEPAPGQHDAEPERFTLD